MKEESLINLSFKNYELTFAALCHIFQQPQKKYFEVDSWEITASSSCLDPTEKESF